MATFSVKDSYKGQELSALRSDQFAKAAIDHEMLVEDMMYMDTKWWDYRTLHPTQATAYFFHVYGKLVTDALARNVNLRASQQWQQSLPGRNLLTFKPQTIRAFWKARMAADAIGVPYERYIKIALKHFYDHYHMFSSTMGGKQDIPYPNQLVSETIMRKVKEDWDEECAVRVKMPDSPLILGQQIWFRPAMEAWIRDTASKTEYPTDFISRAEALGAILPSRDEPVV